MYAAIFHSANGSYAPSHDESSIEVHHNLELAIASLMERYVSGMSTKVDYTTLDGVHHEVHMPGVELGDSLTLYRLNDHTEPDAVATEEEVLEVLTAIHGGWGADYSLVLAEYNADVAVTVSA